MGRESFVDENFFREGSGRLEKMGIDRIGSFCMWRKYFKV